MFKTQAPYFSATNYKRQLKRKHTRDKIIYQKYCQRIIMWSRTLNMSYNL